MLKEVNGVIQETAMTVGTVQFSANSANTTADNCLHYYPNWYPTTYWQTYPVYVYTDKTKKAIEVLKALQEEKLLKCDSVSRFIALVEKISELL